MDLFASRRLLQRRRLDCTPPTVVAIPACDEVDRIGACLQALADQLDTSAAPLEAGQFGVVLFLNNCTDGTDTMARLLEPSMPFPMRIVEQVAPRDVASAGWARRIAMDCAAQWLEESGNTAEGVILTTDADSRVTSDWVAANLRALARGADGVAGCIALDPQEEAQLPDALRRRGVLEAQYETLLTELRARLDPKDHDPWPHHATASGASLAVTLAAYRKIGGLPLLALGEDKAFVEALEAHDALVRHAPDVKVITSGRLVGRAPGGVADTMRLRCAQPDIVCDETLEPVMRAIQRAVWRRRLRSLQQQRRLAEIGRWASALQIAHADASKLVEASRFGAVWAMVERASPLLRRRGLKPAALPAQIMLARLVLFFLRARDRNQRQPSRSSRNFSARSDFTTSAKPLAAAMNCSAASSPDRG